MQADNRTFVGFLLYCVPRLRGGTNLNEMCLRASGCLSQVLCLRVAFEIYFIVADAVPHTSCPPFTVEMQEYLETSRHARMRAPY